MIVDILGIAAADPAVERLNLSRADLADVAAALDRARSHDQSIAGLAHWVAGETGVSRDVIYGPRGDQEASQVRAAVAWGARKILHRSLPQIGRALGNRDHSTISSAICRADWRRERDSRFRDLTDRMFALFTQEQPS